MSSSPNPSHPPTTETETVTADQISVLAREHGYTVAVAESLTGGSLAAALAAADDSSEWFAGGVVAYRTRTKQRVLDVAPDCPVISAECVTTMATSLTDLMEADAVIAISGAGGPAGQEGQPPGTVFIATLVRGRACVGKHHFPGSPEEVLAEARAHALRQLAAQMRG